MQARAGGEVEGEEWPMSRLSDLGAASQDPSPGKTLKQTATHMPQEGNS